MRKSYVVQEYTNKSVPGTFVMKDKTNFMCGKMMDIEDIIRVSYPYDLSKITTYTNTHLYKFDLSYDNAKQNSIISINQDKAQSKIDSETNTKWIFEFNSKYLLREYLYNEIYTLNPHSAFNNIEINNVKNNKISDACYDYIDKNLLDRYKVKEIIFWTKNYQLKQNTVPGSGVGNTILNPEIKLLYKTPVFSLHAIDTDSNKQSISIKQYNDGIYEISYKQTESSQYYTFIYYYDVIYEKI